MAGQCLRALRLEAHLLLVHHLAELPRSDYQCEEEDTREVDECIGALCRSVARWAGLRLCVQALGLSAVQMCSQAGAPAPLSASAWSGVRLGAVQYCT